ncbi:unnamed protein product [Camellia sinensis]
MAIVRSQETSSSNSHCGYDVFLSFRGEDTRKTFTDHLYTALVHAGFRTFRDDDGIERGENIKLELNKAIQESKISIVVFSKDYASSSWCLDELVMILKRRTVGHVVLPVFYHVDPSHVRKQKGSFKEAFTRHEERFHAEASERMEEWKAALKEAADLAGMNLQNQTYGKIVEVVEDKLSRTALGTDPHLIGIYSRAKNIGLWLQDESSDVGIVAICGMGGMGKTTIAKELYNSNFSRFEGSSFLANVREIVKQQDGLLRLQRQLLSDMSKGRKENLYNVDEGVVKIKNALCCKKVLVVLDDVDTRGQLDAILGMRDWLCQGSKIIITTRREQLLKAHEVCQVHKVENLDNDESLELFSWHAFGKNRPKDGFIEDSKRVVRYCGGLPLAIKILGASLSGSKLDVWKSQLQKLKAIPNSEVIEKLKISYDSLPDDHDKNLFLHVACFFVGMDKDQVVTILDGCDFYTTVGIQNLIDRYLLTINEQKKLVMHQLVQEMGREIVRQESPKEPGERSRLWNCKDSLNVLRENIGTRKIEGLKLDMNLLKEDKYDRTIFGVNRKRHYDEFLNMPFSSNVGNSFKRYYFSFSKNVGTALGNSNQIPLEVDAFARMHKLKLLQLKYIQISGSFENFPKGLRWLCWHGFPFKSIPHDFPLENLTILDMSYSRLQIAWKGAKLLESLKILDLSHSHCLIKTPDFSKAPNLERLILKNCATLVEVHESVGHLQRLVLFNLKDCKSLKKLPRSIGMLKFLETFDISGCSNLEELPTELGTLESLTVFHANKIDISRLFSTSKEVKSWHSLIWPSLLTPRRSMEISWSFLPRSVVHLSLKNCNLSDDDFPRDLSNLSSLQILNLSGTAIRSVPNCIRDHFGLQTLCLDECEKLWSVEVQHKLKELSIDGCKLLLPYTLVGRNHKIVEILGMFKLEPLGNVDMEMINNLSLSNIGSMGCSNALLSCLWEKKTTKLPLQGCHERHIFYAYCLGSKVPDWFNLKNEGSSISFTVPSHLNFGIRCLSVCSIYALSNNQKEHNDYNCDAHTIISNMTKSLIWSHTPYVFGFPEADEDMMMLSYWKFENQLESGDELNISVVVNEDLQVKEVGVHLVYKEQEEKGSQSTSEEASQQFSLYGNVVPGNPSAVRPARKKVYLLGNHLDCCSICDGLYSQPSCITTSGFGCFEAVRLGRCPC